MALGVIASCLGIFEKQKRRKNTKTKSRRFDHAQTLNHAHYSIAHAQGAGPCFAKKKKKKKEEKGVARTRAWLHHQPLQPYLS